jgi:hypothetical protein
VLRKASPKTNAAEAGSTLTEVLVALIVAASLIAGLVEVSSRFASTSAHVRAGMANARAVRTAELLMQMVERSDPGSLEVRANRLTAHVGDAPITATLHQNSNETDLEWSSASTARSARLGTHAHFERTPTGSVRLLNGPNEPPLAMATPMRDTPYDCRFDTISRVCR